MATRLARIRGALALVGSFIDELGQDAVRHAHSFTDATLNAPQPYHITLLTKAELRTLPRERVDSLKPDLQHIYPAGVGGNKNAGVFYIVIIWATGQQLRKQLGLAPKHFHVTLSSNDNHDMDKGIDSLFPNQFPVDPALEFIDHLAFTLHGFGQYSRSREFSSQFIVRQPGVPKGYLRLADSTLGDGLKMLAMLAYACAYKRVEDGKIQSYCIKKIIDCSKDTEWGPVLQEHEITALFEEISNILLEPWSASLCGVLSFHRPKYLPPCLLCQKVATCAYTARHNNISVWTKYT